MNRGPILAALCVAAGGAGCGAEPASTGVARACDGPSGPFCLSAGDAVRELEAARVVTGCLEAPPARAILPRPAAARHCTTPGGGELRLDVFRSADHAVRARPSVIDANALRPVPDRAVMAHNVIAVADRLTRDSVQALRAVGRLGDRAG